MASIGGVVEDAGDSDTGFGRRSRGRVAESSVEVVLTTGELQAKGRLMFRRSIAVCVWE
jgi:hypothetical protein